jgi:hypothetical protein
MFRQFTARERLLALNEADVKGVSITSNPATVPYFTLSETKKHTALEMTVPKCIAHKKYL